MKRILGSALALWAALALFAPFEIRAQSEVKLPELPAPAGPEAVMPVLPAPSSTYDPIPKIQAPAVDPAPPQRQMTEEEIQKLKEQENWLVEGMKKKQEEAALLAKKSSDLNSKKDLEPAKPKESTFQPGELSTFKPVVADSSLASLNLNPDPKGNKKKATDLNSLALPDIPSAGSNPLSSTNTSPVVQPILGPSRQPANPNVATLNPGLGVTPLPETGIKKISSNTNFIPEGYADSWTKQQQSPYSTLNPQANKPIPPPATVVPRPTFKDLANTIPDPTQVR